jgi:hypothetical protein
MRQNPLASEATMHTDAQGRRPRGRLSREDQRRISDILRRVYDVPDRFKDLLDQFDQPKDVGEAAAYSMRAQAEGHHQPDRLVGAKAASAHQRFRGAGLRSGFVGSHSFALRPGFAPRFARFNRFGHRRFAFAAVPFAVGFGLYGGSCWTWQPTPWGWQRVWVCDYDYGYY